MKARYYLLRQQLQRTLFRRAARRDALRYLSHATPPTYPVRARLLDRYAGYQSIRPTAVANLEHWRTCRAFSQSGRSLAHLDSSHIRISEATQQVVIRGWVMDTVEKISQVSLSIGSSCANLTIFPRSRADVQQAFPGLPHSERCGFISLLPLLLDTVDTIQIQYITESGALVSIELPMPETEPPISTTDTSLENRLHKHEVLIIATGPAEDFRPIVSMFADEGYSLTVVRPQRNSDAGIGMSISSGCSTLLGYLGSDVTASWRSVCTSKDAIIVWGEVEEELLEVLIIEALSELSAPVVIQVVENDSTRCSNHLSDLVVVSTLKREQALQEGRIFELLGDRPV